MQRLGLVSGYKVGDVWQFRPNNPLYRAQFAKMIANVMELPTDESLTSPFLDLGPDDIASLYPHEYVAAAASAGITQGTGPTEFSPWANLTRAQAITMIVRAADQLAPGALFEPPTDYSGTIGMFDPTHGPTMAKAEFNHLLDGLTGFGAGWDPWATIDRGSTAEVLVSLLKAMAPLR